MESPKVQKVSRWLSKDSCPWSCQPLVDFQQYFTLYQPSVKPMNLEKRKNYKMEIGRNPPVN